MHIVIRTHNSDQPVSFDGKKIMNAEEENEKSIIMLAAASNAMSLAAEIMPALPAEYQNILINLLNP